MADDVHASLAQAAVRSRAALAAARDRLRCLLEAYARLWLARAVHHQPAAPGTLVLLDHLSGFLVIVCAGAFRG